MYVLYQPVDRTHCVHKALRLILTIYEHHFCTASNGKLGGAWEQVDFPPSNCVVAGVTFHLKSGGTIPPSYHGMTSHLQSGGTICMTSH